MPNQNESGDKQKGGYNNDWDLTKPSSQREQMRHEGKLSKISGTYLGDEANDGLHRNESGCCPNRNWKPPQGDR
jgi:hypothetical protein